MIEFNLETSGGGSAPSNFAVSVVGIGGSGSNVLDRIALEGMPGAELICMSSDIRVLNNSMAAKKIQLGSSLTQGLGAGGDPELGLEAAQTSADDIRALFKDRAMVFLCTGLGGGTGSGAAPYIAKLAREAGAFVVVFATLPFSFEGRRRQRQAFESLDELRRTSNALVTFENDRLGELILPKKGIQEAFQLADKIIGQSVRAVTSLVTQPGLIRIGMDDLITALRNTDSRCLFGFGQAKGENRALEALAQALKSPLLDRGQMLAKAQNVLVHVCGGNTMTLFEIETLMRELGKHVHEDAHLLFGAASDNRLGEHISVTLLSSLGKESTVAPPVAKATPQPAAAPTPAPVTAAAPFTVEAPPAPAAAKPQVSESAPTTKLTTPPASELKPAAPKPIAEAQSAIPAPPPQQSKTAPEAQISTVTSDSAPRLKAKPAPAKPTQQQRELLPDEPEIEFDDELEPLVPSSVKSIAPATPPPGKPAIYQEDPVEEDLDEVIAEEDDSIYDDEEEEEEVAPPPPVKKFAIRDILMKPRTEGNGTAKPAAAQQPARPAQTQPVAGRPQPPQQRPAPQQQQNFDERLQGANRGRFDKTEPNLDEEGDDLDVPTFLRKKR